jgi:hypothetical protein
VARHNRTKRAATPIHDLSQPEQELTGEQAERVRGGKMDDNLQKKNLLRQAEAMFEGSTGQSYTVEDFLGDVGG